MVFFLLLILLNHLLSTDVYCQQTYPYVSFMSQTLANHSYIDLTAVVNPTDYVQCFTDLSTCCSSTEGIHRGDWFFPDGNRLPFSGDIYESRRNQRVELRRSNDIIPPSGIYRCAIPTDDVHDDSDISVRESVYVGLYASRGNITIVEDIEYTEMSDIKGPSPQFTLTCITTGGPATTVTWTRDSELVEGGDTVFNDPITAKYTHSLTVTGRVPGIYNCKVENNKPSHDTARICILSDGTPKAFKAEEVSSRQVNFSWSHPQAELIDDNFFLSCSPSPLSLPQIIIPHTLSILVTGFLPRTQYACSLVAISTTNCQDSTTPFNVSFTTDEDYSYIQLRVKGVLTCPELIYSGTREKLEDVSRKVVELLKQTCSECDSSLLDQQSFSCQEETPLFVTYRARLEGTTERDSSFLVSLIEDWVRDGASVIVTGVMMTVDSDCPVIISSLSDPQCQTASPSPTASVENCLCTFYIVGGAVIAGVCLLVAVGTFVFAVCYNKVHIKKRQSYTTTKNSAYEMKGLCDTDYHDSHKEEVPTHCEVSSDQVTVPPPVPSKQKLYENIR